MKKYQDMFVHKYRSILDTWEEKETVNNQDIYRFLHSIKGTASSIGFENLTELAIKLLERIDTEAEHDWKEQDWRTFVQPIALLLNADIKEEKQELKTLKGSQYAILIIDDDMEVVNKWREQFEEKGIMVLIAMDVKRAIKIFYDMQPEMIIIGLKFTNIIRLMDNISKVALSTFTPVMGAGEFTDSEKIQLYKAGVQDHFTKSVRFSVLYALIENRLNFRKLLKSQIMVDELTNAYNRTFLHDMWSHHTDLYESKNQPFTIALLDLDNFKEVNDKHGHNFGDVVLKEFSNLILDEKRNQDYFIRYGGEEFILFLPGTTEEQGAKLVNDLLDKFKKLPFTNDKNETLYISFTAGVSEYSSQDRVLEDLVKKSDDALYHGKESGKGQVQIYHSNINLRSFKEDHKVLKIGIVDDDRIIQRMLSDQLSRMALADYHVEVKTFREGETFIESDWYKHPGKYVILLDGIMPRMDGIEVLRKLRSSRNDQNMAIIMLTGRQKDSDIVQALELGADDYITKPFSLKQLEARIRRIVNRMF
ncbi:diguanylate cyclase [Radiobacillus kanasensis]|uniref:diguanylate cyclase n=1 Tax=Radiobacillus kanasensis TaxID=2844358 RepID=UPI001E637B97|nr:diguanylate cyclase [Radiobacillus kanasensis]UFU00542.1 diguanylate cyclase [Radiobacillus kanasensis]